MSERFVGALDSDVPLVPSKFSSGPGARLIKKVYDADPLSSPRCHKPMKALAVITDATQALRILRHLVKTCKPPPGPDASCLN